MPITPDLAISNQGSIFLFHPLTEAAREWIAEHFTGRPGRAARRLKRFFDCYLTVR